MIDFVLISDALLYFIFSPSLSMGLVLVICISLTFKYTYTRTHTHTHTADTRVLEEERSIKWPVHETKETTNGKPSVVCVCVCVCILLKIYLHMLKEVG